MDLGSIDPAFWTWSMDPLNWVLACRNNKKLKKAEKRTINMMQINSIHSFSDKLSDKV